MCHLDAAGGRDSYGISKLPLILLILPYKVGYLRGTCWIVSIRRAGISLSSVSAPDLTILIGAHRSKQLSNWSEF